jgi:DNA repair exonuclease SbcCD ATPase subunit
MAAASSKMEVQLNLLWAQYEKGLAQAEKVTATRSKSIAAILNKVGNSYSKAIMSGAVGLFGANALDQGIRALAKEIDSLDLSKFRDMGQVVDSIGSALKNVITQIPLIGSLFQLGESIGNALLGSESEAAQAKAAEEHLKRMAELGEQGRRIAEETARIERERQSNADGIYKTHSDFLRDMKQAEMLNKATSDEERVRLQRHFEIEDALRNAQEQMRSTNIAADYQKRILEEIEQGMKRKNEMEDERKRKIEEANAAKQVELEMERLQSDLARAQAEAGETLASIQRSSNISSIGTAVGGVRVAGAVDYSSERMATNLERIRDIETRIEENTRKTAEAQRAT